MKIRQALKIVKQRCPATRGHTWDHACTVVNRARFREAERDLLYLVDSWVANQCPVRFIDWDPVSMGWLIGDEGTMAEFGGSRADVYHLKANVATPPPP